MNEKKNDFLLVISFIWKWKFHLIIFSIICAVVAIIFSAPVFITPKFKSTVTFYPTTAMSISKGLMSKEMYGDSDFLTIGESEEAEQLMQILESDLIRYFLNKKYNLMQHYGIKEDDKYAQTKFGIRFRKNVKSEITKYNSIKVSVLDEDRFMAAKMANDIVEIMDSIRNDILKTRAYDGLKIVERDYIQKKKQVEAIADSLRVIASYGVLKYEEQSQALTEAYSHALQSGNVSILRKIEEKLELLSRYGPVQQMLSNELEFETEQLVLLGKKLDHIRIDAENFIPHKFIVEKAQVSERKDFPKRSIITLVALFSGFFFMLLLLIFYENVKDYDFSRKQS
jgi:hypothetical protein